MLMIDALEINEAGKGSVILNKMNQRRHKTPAHLSSVPPVTLAHSNVLEAEVDTHTLTCGLWEAMNR